MSLGRLSGSTVLDLLLALLIAFGGVFAYAAAIAPTTSVGLARVGRALGLPVPAADTVGPGRYLLSMDCTALPADDQALIDWLRDHVGARSISVERGDLPPGPQGETRQVRATFYAPERLQQPPVPWQKLGYQPGQPAPRTGWSSLAPALAFNTTDAELLLISLGSLQAGLLLAGLIRTWRNRRLASLDLPREDGDLAGGLDTEGEEQDDPTRPREDRALFSGLVVGVVLGGLYWACDQALLHLGGPPAAHSRPWLCLPSVGWNVPRIDLPFPWRSVEPHLVLLLTLAGMAFLFPLAYTVFFGGLFRMWSASGRPWAGAILTVLLAGAMVLDPRFFPAAVLLAVPVIWLLWWSRSLLGSLLALIILSLVMIGTAFGVIPGLHHPTNLIIGRWQPLDGGPPPPKELLLDPTQDGPLQFLRGDGLRGGATFEGDARRCVLRQPSRYQWLDAEHIRLIVKKDSFDNTTSASSVETDLERDDYRVEVGRKELVLTRIGDGKVFHFRRVE